MILEVHLTLWGIFEPPMMKDFSELVVTFDIILQLSLNAFFYSYKIDLL